MDTTRTTAGQAWPALPLDAWRDTRDTLHLWTQVVGKVRLALAPRMNHWWQVPLYVSARGLTTSPIPYGSRTFEVLFDFITHDLHVYCSDGQRKSMPLVARSVADFYAEFQAVLRAIGVDVHVWAMPVEVADPIPFDRDDQHAAYDPAFAAAFWRALTQADAALKAFSARFEGKQSPTHFFWGSFDLTQTRFSGRRAPLRQSADRITKEAFSHEVMSFGFWTGTAGVVDAGFYANASPEPSGFRDAAVVPEAAFYLDRLRQFVLPYAAVRGAADPGEVVLAFFESAYEAGADLGRWDRAALERVPRDPPGPGAAQHQAEEPPSLVH